MTTSEQQPATAIEQENARLLHFLYACPVGLLDMASDGTIGMINPMAMQLLLKLSPVPSLNFLQIIETCAPEIRNLKEGFQDAQGAVFENHRIVARVEQGSETAYEVIACSLIKLGPERYVVSLNDISHQMAMERRLNVAESWFASLLDSTTEFGVASLDRAGKFASVSSSIARQTGFEELDMLGQTLQYLEDAGSMDDKATDQQLAIAAREGWHLHEDWHRHKDGSKVWYQRLVAVQHTQGEKPEDERVSGYTVILREGKPQSLNLSKLKNMLTRDHLTGAYNRMYLFEALEKESVRKKRYKQSVALVAVDIDFFKQVNDSHGHAAGDQVLKQFAEHCMGLLRPVDTMARMGGEEFAILMPSTNLDGAAHMAERLRVATESLTIQLATTELKVTASFGCSELNGACDPTTLLAEADMALYEAKQAGRNAVMVHDRAEP